MRAEYVPPELTHDPIAQDVHCLVQCPAQPHRMWVQHHNGIFISSDEGGTFNEITGVEPSTFGFAVVVHPNDPDTAWFVPEIKDEKRVPRDGRPPGRLRDARRRVPHHLDPVPGGFRPQRGPDRQRERARADRVDQMRADPRRRAAA